MLPISFRPHIILIEDSPGRRDRLTDYIPLPMLLSGYHPHGTRSASLELQSDRLESRGTGGGVRTVKLVLPEQ